MTFSGKDSDTQCRCDSLDDVRAFHEIGGASYETQVSDDQNLTFEYAAAYFQARGAPFEAQWRAMKLIDADGLFTNLALLLSDQCRHSLHAAVFRGTEKIEFQDRVVFTGSLLKQFEEVCGYLRRFNGNRSSKGEVSERPQTTDYPSAALREGILNAIVHRDYEGTGPILVSLFDDRLEILNQGGLLPKMTTEEVRKGVVEQRNKALAAVFQRLKLVDAFGTGCARMNAGYAECAAKPQIAVTPKSFELILPNRNVSNTSREDIREAVSFRPDNQRPRGRRTNGLGMSAADAARSEDVLTLCWEKGELSRQDVQVALGLSQTAAILFLNRMLASRQIVRVKHGRSVRYELPPLSVDQEV